MSIFFLTEVLPSRSVNERGEYTEYDTVDDQGNQRRPVEDAGGYDADRSNGRILTKNARKGSNERRAVVVDPANEWAPRVCTYQFENEPKSD